MPPPVERSNQILSLHRVSPRCYDLTNVRTGSVRDQLLRATLLAHTLFATGLIKAPSGLSGALLVLGAGPAGIALALAAAEYGVDVTVIELQQDPFYMLRNSRRRIIDPTEYDWPQPHWQHGKLPLDTRKGPLTALNGLTRMEIPLPVFRHDGATLAAVWSNVYHRVLYPPVPETAVPVGAGPVKILYGKDARDLLIDDASAARQLAICRRGSHPMTSPSKSSATTPVMVAPANWPGWPPDAPLTFGAVVSCIGFGDEIVSERPVPNANAWTDFSGYRFWLDDDKMRAGYLQKSIHGYVPTSILISGGGDGAMQDFQRAATGLFGRALYEKIEDVLRRERIRFAPEELMREATLVEDRARRAHSWRQDEFAIDGALGRWQKAYDEVITDMFAQWGNTGINALARNVLRPELERYLAGQGGLQVVWIMRDEVPGYVFGLNRMLSYLLVSVIAHVNQRGPQDPVGLFPLHEIVSITPLQRLGGPYHSCGKPDDCYAQPHLVMIASKGSFSSGEPGFRTFSGEYDLILIRHGQESIPLLGGASVPEQHVPFDLPH